MAFTILISEPIRDSICSFPELYSPVWNFSVACLVIIVDYFTAAISAI